MGLVSALLLGVAIATTRIILQREDMLTEGSITITLGLGAVLLLLYFRNQPENGDAPDQPEGGDPTPPSNPSSTLDGPANVERWLGEATRAANLTPGQFPHRDTILAVIWQESAGNPDAVGSAGEQGLMQVTGVAAEDVGETLPTTSAPPQRQITVGAKYLAKCYEYVGQDEYKALRCYNEGPPPLTRAASKKYATEVLDKRDALHE
jgi:hypothetical protein